MTQPQLLARLRSIVEVSLPIPGRGQTALRHRHLMKVGREDLSLARLAEAHWDAVAILVEAGLAPKPNALYGVWASEKPSQPLTLHSREGRLSVSGSKMFCTGAGLIDRALVTVSVPESRLVDVDLHGNPQALSVDYSDWKTNAFAETLTASVIFNNLPVSEESLVGSSGWYLERPGFWHGACGPAACWAGGAARLLDYALAQLVPTRTRWSIWLPCNPRSGRWAFTWILLAMKSMRLPKTLSAHGSAPELFDISSNKHLLMCSGG